MIKLILCISLAIFANFITNTMHLLSIDTCPYSLWSSRCKLYLSSSKPCVPAPSRTLCNTVIFANSTTTQRTYHPSPLTRIPFGPCCANYTCHQANHAYLHQARHHAIQTKNLWRNQGFCRLATVNVHNTPSNLYHVPHQKNTVEPVLTNPGSVFAIDKVQRR